MNLRVITNLALSVSLFLFLITFQASSVHSPESTVIFEGIDIIFVPEPKMFPPSWYCHRVNAQAAPLSPRYRTQAKDILNRAFLKYPEPILFGNLRKVYVMESLIFFGVPYGGTNSRDIIYITYEETNPQGAEKFIEGIFHHEFSSVLYKKFHKYFNKEAWLAVNKPGFEYGEGGVKAIINGEASMEFNDGLHELGFLNEYSQSAFEEDFNVFSQNLFCGGLEFWNIVDNYEKIKDKSDLIIAFYQQIDPSFTEEYFRNLPYL